MKNYLLILLTFFAFLLNAQNNHSYTTDGYPESFNTNVERVHLNTFFDQRDKERACPDGER